MNKDITSQEVYDRVKAINKTLYASGLNLKQVEDFWKDIFKEVRKDYIMTRFFNGETDTEIAKDSGYSTPVISDCTRKYWNDKDIGKSIET